jgi:hypothetical protein
MTESHETIQVCGYICVSQPPSSYSVVHLLASQLHSWVKFVTLQLSDDDVSNVRQDEIYLQVIKQSGEGAEKRHASKVLGLLHRGKHWVLVTLLLGNVITNETLPIVLDRSLGGGWPAVLGSTVLIGKVSLVPVK